MLLVRRIVLALVGAVFALVAVASLARPVEMAAGIGLQPIGTDGLSELRAVYVGVWSATAALFALAVRRPADRSLFLACVLLLAGQVVGRAASLAIDGVPGPAVWPAFIVETVGVLALVALRPRAAQRSDGGVTSS